jgi:hypothetical protein
MCVNFYVLKIRLFFETNKKFAKLMIGLSLLGVLWYCGIVVMW